MSKRLERGRIAWAGKAWGLAALLLALCMPAAGQEGQAAVRTRTAVYQDDDATTVLTAGIEAEAKAAEPLTLRASYLLDAVTTASVDVVTAATDRWTERRDDIRGSLDLTLGDVVASGAYGRSIENDYDSHRITGSLAVDLAQRATTLSLGGGAVLSDVGRADDAQFAEELTTILANAGWVQALDPDTLLSLGYTVQALSGYQASPYRFVRNDAAAPVPERHPTERLRHSPTVRLRWAASSHTVLFGDERVYVDDWGMLATTTQLGAVFTLSRAVDLELRNRFHYQRAVDFWRERYTEPRRYMSADRELSTFVDDYVGPALVVSARDAGPFVLLRADVRADFFVYRFFDYRYLDGRVGVLASIGVTGEL